MSSIWAVTFPFFALVACGYAAAYRRVLPESAIGGLNAFVLFFALPCLLFRFGLVTPMAQLLAPPSLMVYGGAALLMVGVAVLLTRRQEHSMKDVGLGALVAAFPNTGFLGVPLLVGLLGTAAAGPTVCAVLIDIVLTSSLCIALAHTDGEQVPWRRVLRGTLINPLPWSIAAGAAFQLLGWGLPGPVMRGVSMLADSASPVALFTIGAVLWRAAQHSHQPTPWPRYLPIAALKLLLHPLLVGGLAWATTRLGFGPTPSQAVALILVAALPSASNVSLLAERYGADNGRIARVIMASTVMAFVSFGLVAGVLGVKP